MYLDPKITTIVSDPGLYSLYSYDLRTQNGGHIINTTVF